ncbi:MAG: hypothetical protein JNM68_06350 [Dinghuibacter sp.]|nr:hypothetical protein [Dinghuibacter sp.]
MIVRQTSWSSSQVTDIRSDKRDDKVSNMLADPILATFFVKTLPGYFKDKDYGKGVKELLYKEICFDDDFKIFAPPLDQYYYYSKKLKAIAIVVDLDYHHIKNLQLKGLCNYIASCYINVTKECSRFEIKDFDLNAYKTDFSNLLKNEGLISE